MKRKINYATIFAVFHCCYNSLIGKIHVQSVKHFFKKKIKKSHLPKIVLLYKLLTFFGVSCVEIFFLQNFKVYNFRYELWSRISVLFWHCLQTHGQLLNIHKNTHVFQFKAFPFFQFNLQNVNVLSENLISSLKPLDTSHPSKLLKRKMFFVSPFFFTYLIELTNAHKLVIKTFTLL